MKQKTNLIIKKLRSGHTKVILFKKNPLKLLILSTEATFYPSILYPQTILLKNKFSIVVIIAQKPTEIGTIIIKFSFHHV